MQGWIVANMSTCWRQVLQTKSTSTRLVHARFITFILRKQCTWLGPPMVGSIRSRSQTELGFSRPKRTSRGPPKTESGTSIDFVRIFSGPSLGKSFRFKYARYLCLIKPTQQPTRHKQLSLNQTGKQHINRNTIPMMSVSTSSVTPGLFY